LDLGRGRREDAQTKLEHALMLDPSLADAEESFGFLLLRTEQLEEAEKHFIRAAELDPKRPLAFYGQGMVAMSRGGSVGVPVGAVVAFEKTVALSPDFAPAWYNLSSIYALRKETLQKALDAAQHAASLVPGDSGYQYQVAVILENLGRMDEARKVAEHIRNSSSDLKEADKAGDLIAQMSQPRPPAAPVSPASASAPPPAASASRPGPIEKKPEPDDGPSEAPPSRTRELPAPPPAPPAPPPLPEPVIVAPPAPAPIPPLTVDAKYFGYVSDTRGSHRKAFFATANNDEVVIAGEGDTLLGHFRVIRISIASADVEEVSSGRHATLILEEPGPNG